MCTTGSYGGWLAGELQVNVRILKFTAYPGILFHLREKTIIQKYNASKMGFQDNITQSIPNINH